MAIEDIQRMNYYEKQFLRTRDFQDEQAYHIEMRRRHLIAGHTWGIVQGMEITQDATSLIFSVQPGLAVDGLGREIVVPAAEPLDVGEVQAQLAGAVNPTELKVWIAYQLEKTDQPAPGYEVCGIPGQFTRLRETYRLIYQDDPPTMDQTLPPGAFEDLPDDPAASPWPVFLGTITYDPGKKAITAVDPKDRRYAGLVGAEIRPPSPAQAVPAATTPLPSDLTLRAEEIHLSGPDATRSSRTIADGNVELDGGKLDLRSSGGMDTIPLQIYRNGVKDLRLQLGASESEDARLTAGAGNDEKLVLKADGTMQVDGGLEVKSSKDLSLDGGKLSLKNENGTETPDVTQISRGLGANGHSELRLAVGTATSGARLVVGPQNGANVDAKLAVDNSGNVTATGQMTVGGNLTVQGFTLTHGGADFVINGRTGGTPRALVDFNKKLVVNFAGDYLQGVEVQSNLNVTGSLTVAGQNITFDTTKLNGISDGAKNVSVISGVLFDGGTVPLPSGFIESQCRWIVSPEFLDPGYFDINENGPSARFKVECYTSGRVLTCKWWQAGHSSTPGFVAHSGYANYLVIGVK